MAIAALVVSIISAIIAGLTWYAAKRIAFVQQWNTLVTEYRSNEFGAAVQSVCDFFVTDCCSQIGSVQKMYERRREQESGLAAAETLSFKRRMLAQYYWQLYVCIQNGFPFAKRWVKKYFNKNEMNIMAIIYQMCAVEDRFYPSLWLDENGHKARCEEPYEIKECIRKLYVRFEKIFKKDIRKAQPLEPGNAEEKTGESSDAPAKEIDARRTETMGNNLIFTNGGTVVHFAYTVKDGIKKVNVSANPAGSAFKNDGTAECALFSDAVTVIAQSAFEGCAELQIAEWGNDIVTNGEDGKIPLASVKESLIIQYHAFKDCSKLHTVVFPKANAKDDAPAKNDKIIIEKEAFSDCHALRTVVLLGSGSFVIADDAFCDCSTDRLVFVVTEGSQAERYAREHGYRYIGVDNVQ